jgi:hypothetical protein
MNNKDFIVLDILNLCGIKAISIESIDNIMFERNLLLNNQTYNLIREKIPDIKNVFSSSYFNSLHKNAQNNQKWPLINLVRQILLFYGFKLTPIRKANGYSKDKTKLYKRFFLIQKVIS